MGFAMKVSRHDQMDDFGSVFAVLHARSPMERNHRVLHKEVTAARHCTVCHAHSL